MEKDRKKSMVSSMLLMLTALIWGVAFVAQSEGLNYVGAFTLNGSRFLVGGMVLLPYLLLTKKNGNNESAQEREVQRRRLKTGVIGGICCGCFLCLASSLQQFGIAYTTVGKAGFITALYIVIVPLLGLFMHHKVGLNIWLSVLIASAGMYLLCITEEFSIGRGDLLVFVRDWIFDAYSGH